MKYTQTNIIGDAGEHLLAAKVIKYFGFPCRLINIDIGIDAEIEIIDANYKSTGQFIKAQVKTTTTEVFHLFIDEKHLKYWNMMHFPAVIFLVHLHTENIYWHCIEKTEAYIHSKSGLRITFDPEHILVPENKEKFIEISYDQERQTIASIYSEAYEVANADTEILDEGNYDLTSFEEFVYHCNKILFDLKKADKIIRKVPGLQKVKDQYYHTLQTVELYLKRIEEQKQSILEDYGHDFYDHLNEDRWTWD